MKRGSERIEKDRILLRGPDGDTQATAQDILCIAESLYQHAGRVQRLPHGRGVCILKLKQNEVGLAGPGMYARQLTEREK